MAAKKKPAKKAPVTESKQRAAPKKTAGKRPASSPPAPKRKQRQPAAEPADGIDVRSRVSGLPPAGLDDLTIIAEPEDHDGDAFDGLRWAALISVVIVVVAWLIWG